MPADVQDVKIKLQNYYGPLDLLLQLVKEDELDVLHLRMAEVVNQYIQLLEQAKELNMDLAGEFLVLSSQLMLLKSRRVVPALDETEEAQQEEETISMDLIRKLLEYKRFKEFAGVLEKRAADFSRRHGRPPIRLEAAADPDAPIEVDLWKLVSSFAKVSQSLRLDTGLNIVYQDIPIERMMTSILDRVRASRHVSFKELVGDPRDRLSVVFNFLAVLELVKQQSLEAKMDDQGRDIIISLPEDKP
jgi:segregation and condensation protein A